jgi:anti-sigma-K factor RskA
MDIKEYIASGILELYVAGALSEKERQEVYDLLLKHPELVDEVQKIESAIIKLTAAASPSSTQRILESIKKQLNFGNDVKVIDLEARKTPWSSYIGWAAAIVLGLGIMWLMNENSAIKEELRIVETDRELLEVQIEQADSDLAASKKLITVLRDRNIISVPLDGQAVAPDAFAKVYWDKKTNSIYLDAQGLPKAPEGKVYQVWSLTLNPLTPTSLGTIDDFNEDENKIFAMNNNNASEAFGITLEPAGGSATPTLEQLYTLGAIASTP